MDLPHRALQSTIFPVTLNVLLRFFSLNSAMLLVTPVSALAALREMWEFAYDIYTTGELHQPPWKKAFTLSTIRFENAHYRQVLLLCVDYYWVGLLEQ